MERILDDESYIVFSKCRIKCYKKAEEFLKIFLGAQQLSQTFADFNIACDPEGAFFSKRKTSQTELKEDDELPQSRYTNDQNNIDREYAAIDDPNQSSLGTRVNKVFAEAVDFDADADGQHDIGRLSDDGQHDIGRLPDDYEIGFVFDSEFFDNNGIDNLNQPNQDKRESVIEMSENNVIPEAMDSDSGAGSSIDVPNQPNQDKRESVIEMSENNVIPEAMDSDSGAGSSIDVPNQPNQDEWEIDFDICVNDFLNEAINSGKKLYDDTIIPDNQLLTVAENELQISVTENFFRDELSGDELQILRRISATIPKFHEQLNNDELQIFQRVLFDYGINSNIEKVFDDDLKEYLQVGDNSVNTSQQDQLEIVPKCPNSKICKFYCPKDGISDKKYQCVECTSFSVPSFICVREMCCDHYSICIECSMDRRVSKMLRGVMSTRGTAFLAGGKGVVNTLIH